MKDFIGRNTNIFILFVPIAIYLLSYCLFEMNAESGINIKELLLKSISNSKITPEATVLEFKLRFLWLSSSFLSIVIDITAFTWSVVIFRRCYVSRYGIKLMAVGAPIAVLSILQMAYVNPESAMYNSIFDTTYQALNLSALTIKLSIKKVYLIILTINGLAAITPVFIMVAICSAIAVPAAMDVQKKELIITRMNYLNQGFTMGSAVLLFGIIHMFTWMQWPMALFEGVVFKNVVLDLFTAVCQFWGISFSISLIAFYASATLCWQARTRDVLAAVQPDIDIPKWMEENGISISWQKHALQCSTMLTPFLAGSLSHMLSMQ